MKYTITKNDPSISGRYIVRLNGSYLTFAFTLWGAKFAIRRDKKRRDKGAKIVYTEEG